MSDAPYGTVGGPSLPGFATSAMSTMALGPGMMLDSERRIVRDPDAIEPPMRPTAPIRIIAQCAQCGHELLSYETSRKDLSYNDGLEYELADHNERICPVCDAAAVLDRQRYESEWRARWEREHPGEEPVVLA